MNIQTNHLKEYLKEPLQESLKDRKTTNFCIKNIGFSSPYDLSILHRHDFYQIIALKKGSGVHFVDFEQYEMNAPCVSLIFPQQIHKLLLSEDAQGDIIMFDETIFCSAILANELKEYNVDLQKRINFVDFHDSSSDSSGLSSFKDIYKIIDNILSLEISLNEIRIMQIKFFIKIIIFKIIDAASKDVFIGTKSRDFDTYMEFRKLVDIEFATNRKVELYCEKLNISAKKLNAICRQFANKTALTIIHERLSQQIKRIFIFEDMSLKEIAYQLNFNSQSALNKYIASKFGRTPSELKQEVLNNYETK